MRVKKVNIDCFVKSCCYILQGKSGSDSDSDDDSSSSSEGSSEAEGEQEKVIILSHIEPLCD